MLDEGVESRSDGHHRIQWTRIDSDGKVYFLFVRDFEKSPFILDEGVESRSERVHRIHWTRIYSDGKVHFPLILDEGVESRSDGVHRIHWTRIDSDGKVHFLFVRDLEKFRSCWMRGWKVVPMESIGSIGNE